MTLTMTLLGILIFLLCIWGVIAPKALFKKVLDVWNRPWGIYFAIAIRIALGILFVLAADQTRFPGAIRFLGYLMVIAALLIGVIGRQKTDRFINWWKDKPTAFLRVWLVFGMLFAAFIVYAAN